MLTALRRVGAIEVGSIRRELSPAASAWILGALVALSTVGYGLTVGGVKNIWILPDELTYGDLARSFATTGHFAIRGVQTLAYPVGYPLLLSPAFVGRNPAAAYEAAKWLNALLMSLAAVPVFLLARRLLPRGLSLIAAGLTLLIPSFAYTGVLMSENAFFPVVLVVLLAIVRALEVPTAGRQLVALVGIGAAVAVRAEGLVLIPILLSSIALLALSQAERRGGARVRNIARELWHFRVTGLILPLAVAALLLGETAIGKSPGAILGRYAGSLGTYPAGRTLHWAIYVLVDLELYLAVIPFVPAGIVAAALLRRAQIPRKERAVASIAIAATVFFVLAAAAASQGSQGGGFGYPALPPDLHDRYCFYVAPLYLILFLTWVHRRRDFSSRILLPLVVAASALPLVLPYASVHANAEFDALALLPWHNEAIADRNVHYAMAVAAGVLGATLIPRRSSIAVLQIGLVAALLSFVGTLARNNIASASVKIQTSHDHDPSWIDDSVPRGASVAALWIPGQHWSFATTIARSQALWRAELLNPAIKEFFYVGKQMAYDLPAAPAQLHDGRLILPPDTSRSYRYLVVASSVPIDGRIVAADRRAGLVLYRLSSPSP